MGIQEYFMFRGQLIRLDMIIAELRLALGKHPVNNQRRYRKLK